ncbi:MAG TPA: hypothetical protein VII53_09285 [Solirubrobacteraceae bacterium]
MPARTDCPVSEENIRVISTEEKGSDGNGRGSLLELRSIYTSSVIAAHVD